MARAGPRKVARYGDRFKATAVKLSSLPGVLIKDVAAALDIHPFMLSLWRKQVRDGVIKVKGAALDVRTVAELRRLREVESRYQLLREEHELLSHPVCFRSKAEVFEFIKANRWQFKVTAMCRLYGVTRAGYYAWRARGRSARSRANEQLAHQIRAVHEESRGTYGSPRIYQALRRRGCRASENRIARVMRAQGIRARVATIRYTNPRLQHFFAAVRNEQLERALTRPDQVWVGDITYLKVGAIYRYLAVVMDKYSRRLLGWAYGKRKDVALTLRALERAVRLRRPPRGSIFHTDRGIEYAAGAFKERALELGIVQSMNRPGKLNDNAYIESFFHSLKADIVHGLRFTEDRQIERAVRAYVPFYNGTRLHSSLDYVPPATFERLT